MKRERIEELAANFLDGNSASIVKMADLVRLLERVAAEASEEADDVYDPWWNRP